MASTAATATSVSTNNHNGNISDASFPREYQFRVSQECVRQFKDPHNAELLIHHVYVPVREFAHGQLPDDVNPRSHDNPTGRIPQLIEDSVKEHPTWFHLLNRGELVLAQRCWYDNKTQLLHIAINDRTDGGVADGATTDRVLQRVKKEVAEDLSKIPDDQLPAFLQQAHVHLEIISGTITDEMLVALARARNTSNQVKEFALENLGGGFDWLKDLIEDSEFKGRVRYRENDPEDVDIRTVLALLTLFHPNWDVEGKEPVSVFSSKGMVLDYYRKQDWVAGYQALKPIALDILRLSDFIQTAFPEQYLKYKGDTGKSGRLGGRKEVRYNKGRQFTLPLTQAQTEYLIPDGWLYPILASFRQLVKFNGTASWITDAGTFFTEHGHELVGDVAEQSQQLGSNPGATGKSRMLWKSLRNRMELYRMKLDQPHA